jgi:hypothetical protein
MVAVRIPLLLLLILKIIVMVVTMYNPRSCLHHLMTGEIGG